MNQQIGEALVLLGALLTLLAAMGVVRFGDVFARMQALAKATSLGVLIALVGAAVTLPHLYDMTSLFIAAAIQMVTNPLSSMMLTRATYHAEGIPVEVDTIDELAADAE